MVILLSSMECSTHVGNWMILAIVLFLRESEILFEMTSHVLLSQPE